MKYIIVDVADRYYEEGQYACKFDSFEDAESFLQEHHYDALLEKLNFLESIKDNLYGDEIIVSYN